MHNPNWANDIAWDERGLMPAIAQSATTQRVLMLAWMNREALAATLETGYATYWSRSRGQLWRKGERSGHYQQVVEVCLDCDCDALLLRVLQAGHAACHTGRESCFFRVYQDGGWVIQQPRVVDPQQMYDPHA